MEENRLLDVKDLKVSFFTPSGEVKAVGAYRTMWTEKRSLLS